MPKPDSFDGPPVRGLGPIDLEFAPLLAKKQVPDKGWATSPSPYVPNKPSPDAWGHPVRELLTTAATAAFATVAAYKKLFGGK